MSTQLITEDTRNYLGPLPKSGMCGFQKKSIPKSGWRESMSGFQKKWIFMSGLGEIRHTRFPKKTQIAMSSFGEIGHVR